METLLERITHAEPFPVLGRVIAVSGLSAQVEGLDSIAVGEVCRISGSRGRNDVLGEIVSFREGKALLMPYGDLTGVSPGATVRALGETGSVPVGDGLKGRVIDAMGQPVDGRGPLIISHHRSLDRAPPAAMERTPIHEPLATGVRAIDGLLTIGRGQRVGIFASAGVGKSVLLGQIARNTSADINVIALLGERGREVPDFIRNSLGPEGLKRSIVVVSTGDEGALVRARGALMATSIAEHFRDQGFHVMLMLDSITRVAMAWREIGLAAGEPPATRGYPPSVFAHLPRLLERAGTGRTGSITGLYTVLVEGDDLEEPVAFAARSVLDGHILLSQDLSARRHFPAIDIRNSKSRVRDDVITEQHRESADLLLRAEAEYESVRDLIDIGQYKEGANPAADMRIRHGPEIDRFLRQSPKDRSAFEETRNLVLHLSRQMSQEAVS